MMSAFSPLAVRKPCASRDEERPVGHRLRDEADVDGLERGLRRGPAGEDGEKCGGREGGTNDTLHTGSSAAQRPGSYGRTAKCATISATAMHAVVEAERGARLDPEERCAERRPDEHRGDGADPPAGAGLARTEVRLGGEARQGHRQHGRRDVESGRAGERALHAHRQGQHTDQRIGPRLETERERESRRDEKKGQHQQGGVPQRRQRRRATYDPTAERRTGEERGQREDRPRALNPPTPTAENPRKTTFPVMLATKT